MKKKMLLMF